MLRYKTQQVRASVGQKHKIVVPHSEVCMHMRVAGTIMFVELRASTYGNDTYHSAQLYKLNGEPYSSPITTGEGGFYQDSAGYYTYAICEDANGNPIEEETIP